MNGQLQLFSTDTFQAGSDSLTDWSVDVDGDYDDDVATPYEYNGFSTGDIVVRGNGRKGRVEKGGSRKVTIVWSVDSCHPSPVKITHSRKELELLFVRHYRPDSPSPDLGDKIDEVYPNNNSPSPDLGDKIDQVYPNNSSPSPDLGDKIDEVYPNNSSPSPDLGYKIDQVYPNNSSPSPDLGDKIDEVYPNNNSPSPDLGYKIDEVYPNNSRDDELQELLLVASTASPAKIREAIELLLSPENSLSEPPARRDGSIELKMINGYGPYAYKRVWNGKRHESQYLGKVSQK